MAEKSFSKKEAISHGIKITKKYFGVIFSIVLIYLAFEIVSGLLNSGAGSPIKKEEVFTSLYRESKAADNFYTYLQEIGYIDRFGAVQDKLQSISRASELDLSPDLEADRYRIFSFLNQHRYRLPFPKLIYYLFAIALWVVGVIMQIGWTKICLLLSRDQEPAVSELFSNGSLFITYILASICYGLAVMGGFLLLIIPGIIFSIMLGLYVYFIIDKNMGPLESLRASSALTKGVRWQLLLFGLLLTLFNLAGLLCLLVGLIFTIPATAVAMAYVYDQLLKQGEVAAA
jgi:hypothetical protein